MTTLLLILLAIATALVFILLGSIYAMHKAALEMAESLDIILSTDTNQLLTISSRDPYMCQLAASLNVHLRQLRSQRHHYQNGDRELKEAITGISHDLRTPLTAISGYLELLRQEALGADAKRYLTLIENRTEAMKQLTQELFRYSVVLSAEELTLEEVSLGGALEESIAAFYGALTSRGIQPRILLSGKPIRRLLNKEALSRVFSNVLNNALKYSDGDLEITLFDDGTISFSNSTTALDEIQLGRLFDRFYTVEAGRNSTGLGLSIAKRLMEQMGGSITASYGCGKLTITLIFP